MGKMILIMTFVSYIILLASALMIDQDKDDPKYCNVVGFIHMNPGGNLQVNVANSMLKGFERLHEFMEEKKSGKVH
jgi:hypothetical protein